jgi:hypothetical protein
MKTLLPPDYLNTNAYPLIKRFKLSYMVNRAPKFTLQVCEGINKPLHTVTISAPDVFAAIDAIRGAWLKRCNSVIVRVVTH